MLLQFTQKRLTQIGKLGPLLCWGPMNHMGDRSCRMVLAWISVIRWWVGTKCNELHYIRHCTTWGCRWRDPLVLTGPVLMSRVLVHFWESRGSLPKAFIDVIVIWFDKLGCNTIICSPHESVFLLSISRRRFRCFSGTRLLEVFQKNIEKIFQRSIRGKPFHGGNR